MQTAIAHIARDGHRVRALAPGTGAVRTVAGGGRADFRGQNGTCFAFLSAPKLEVNVMTEARTFKMWRERYDGQIVHGSFITRVFVRILADVGGEHRLEELAQLGVLGAREPRAQLGERAARERVDRGRRRGQVVHDLAPRDAAAVEAHLLDNVAVQAGADEASGRDHDALADIILFEA